MAIVTLPTTLTLTNRKQPRFIEAGEAIEAGRMIKKDTVGRAVNASSANSTLAGVIGLSVSKAYAAGQWIAYGEPGDDFTVSGLTKGVTYYLDQGTNEVQTATITGTPTGGTYKLSFLGVASANIAFDAAAAAVQTALEGISTIGAGNVTVSGSAGGPYTITFKNELGGQDVALLVLNTNALTGGTSPTVGIAETTPGLASGKICLFADLVTGNRIVAVGSADSATAFSFLPNNLNATA
jgi:hypothetical protein